MASPDPPGHDNTVPKEPVSPSDNDVTKPVKTTRRGLPKSGVTARDQVGPTPLSVETNPVNVKIQKAGNAIVGCTTVNIVTHNYPQGVGSSVGTGHTPTSKQGIGDFPQDHSRDTLGIVTVLVENSADVNATDPHGNTPLHTACRERQPAIVSRLIENRGDVNATDQHGYTPLHIACIERHLGIVTLLVENGADVNARTKNGYTPLHIACDSGHKEISQVLLQNQADVTASCDSGHTPLALALVKSHRELGKLLNDFVTISDYGADVNQSVTNRYGDTMLHVACREGHRGSRVEFILHQNSQLDGRDKENTVIRLANDEGSKRHCRIFVTTQCPGRLEAGH